MAERRIASHKRIKTSPGSRAFDIFNYALISIFCFTIFFPLWDTIVISFSRAADVSYLSINFWPKQWVLDSYRYCLMDGQIFTAFRNSALRTAIGSVYHLMVCSLAAFALTKSEMPGQKFFLVLFLITMFFSGGMIPTYLNIKGLGLMNNFLVYVIPGGFSVFNMIIIRNYFFSIDKEMEEAATIDGATAWQVLTRVILPLSKPVLATVGLWQMVGQWNAWFDNMIYCSNPSLLTLQYMLRRMTNQIAAMQQDINNNMAALGEVSLASDTVIAATTVIVVVPIVCVYPFLQKYFVKGIMLGAVKG